MDGLELLVHNLSHSDLVLSLNNNDQSLKPNSVIARPKFSHFQGISEKILTCLLGQNNSVSIAESTLHSRKNVQAESGATVPVGFNFSKCPIAVDDFANLRFRQDDKSTLLQRKDSTNGANSAQNSDDHAPLDNKSEQGVIESAYFPLISVLLPKWLNSIDEDRRHTFNKVIVLVSGRGTPMVQTSGTDNDNSTKCTGELIKLLIQKTYPGVTVKLLHSDSNLFRYDENIVFVKGQLLPLINQYRDQLVCTKGAEWKEHMRVSLSFADGSSARISAINASMRYYRPSYMHFWQLKSFWREQMICEDDIECHSFEEISTEPAIKIENTSADPLVHAVLQEMEAFRAEFTAVVNNSEVENDISSFWLRKTKKPVLAVLLVQKPGQPFKLYRGTNMEVSMPTGSLCAERNVIGTALSADITLRRHDIKIVAVYAASMPSKAPLHRTSSTNSIMDHRFALSKQNSINLGTTSGHDTAGAEHMDVDVAGAERKGVLRTHSANLSDADAPSAGAPTTPISRSRRGSIDSTHEDALTLDTSMGSHQKGVDSTANTPIGSPSAYTPMAGSKRKIMSIHGRSDSITESKDEPDRKHAATNSTSATTTTVVPNGAPPLGRLSHSNLASANDARTTQKLNTGNSSGRRTKTVAFSSSSNNLATQGLLNIDNNPFPDDGSATEDLDNGAASNVWGGSESNIHVPMLVGLSGGGGLVGVETNLLCSPVGQCTSSVAAAMNASAQRQAQGGSAHHAVETETITVDKDDLNPLKPCGACNEWLKKIAEVNPQLRVITFTDAGCRGVHIEQIDD